MHTSDIRRSWRALVVAFLLSVFVFQTWPQLDLWITERFYSEGSGFSLASNVWVNDLRLGIWDLSIAVVLISAIGLLMGLTGRVAATQKRKFGFIFALYLLGPVVLVNGVLKAHWGRARPANVAEFGGGSAFTPPWPPTDQCVSDCSFVSGEGSAAVALFLAMLLFLPEVRSRLPRWLSLVYSGVFVVVPATGAALRVVMGRHFASDTIFGAIFVFAVALLLYPLIIGVSSR